MQQQIGPPVGIDLDRPTPGSRWRPKAAIVGSIGLHVVAPLGVVVVPEAWPWAFGAIAANHLLLARLLVAARLFAPDGAEPPAAAQAALARACEQPDYASLLHALGEARQGVAQCWAELFGEKLEIA